MQQFTHNTCSNYTGVDPKQEFGNKKEEQQASIGAREPRTGDPGTGSWTVRKGIAWDR